MVRPSFCVFSACDAARYPSANDTFNCCFCSGVRLVSIWLRSFDSDSCWTFFAFAPVACDSNFLPSMSNSWVDCWLKASFQRLEIEGFLLFSAMTVRCVLKVLLCCSWFCCFWVLRKFISSRLNFLSPPPRPSFKKCFCCCRSSLQTDEFLFKLKESADIKLVSTFHTLDVVIKILSSGLQLLNFKLNVNFLLLSTIDDLNSFLRISTTFWRSCWFSFFNLPPFPLDFSLFVHAFCILGVKLVKWKSIACWKEMEN